MISDTAIIVMYLLGAMLFSGGVVYVCGALQMIYDVLVRIAIALEERKRERFTTEDTEGTE